ncbi:MAG: hypothetical protein AAGG09_02135 [Pseudomonadota bacterium]
MARIFDLSVILIATLYGLFAYYAEDGPAIRTTLVLAVAAGLIGRAALARLRTRTPVTRAMLVVGALLAYGWIAALFSLIALINWYLLEFTLWLGSELARESSPLVVPAEDVSTVAKLVIGALSGFLGSAIYDDAKKPDSWLWPAQTFRAHLKGAVAAAVKDGPEFSHAACPELYELATEDKVTGGPDGWRFAAGLERAWRIGPLLHAFLNQRTQDQP